MTAKNRFVTHNYPTNVSPKTGQLKRGRKPVMTASELRGLPLSTLIRIAVADAQAAARTPGYKLTMGTWHTPGYASAPKKECSVCMAGACIAGTQAFPKGETWRGKFDEIYDDDDDEVAVAEALNNVRTGDIHEALFNLRGRDYDLKGTLVDVVGVVGALIDDDYHYLRDDGGRAKWSTYLKAAKMLEAVGL